MESEFFTTDEILNLFKIHNQTLKNWRKEKKIPYKKISAKKILYPRQEILNLLNNN